MRWLCVALVVAGVVSGRSAEQRNTGATGVYRPAPAADIQRANPQHASTQPLIVAGKDRTAK